ncbi:MAG: tRNA (adenosine(37)-N6)-threonylcarbamoyltransferase complex ATPase subunit type 1 TsaE [Phycisphaerales bacterium]|nr:tRNA (adenosine(37)-N6)-threonylcarbamoyltransferase complex ATPase subunit type 1 TsaE [Phycisphaerales bacterium]
MSTTFFSHSVAQTEQIAADLASTLGPGDCLALHGDLGAGKTQFVRGLVRAYGGHERAVSSPTYVLLNLYPTPRGAIFHLDAYRISGPADLQAIGFEELLQQQGLVIIEWASRVESLLPPMTLHITLTPTSTTSRQIDIRRPNSP